jgi:5-methylcytosine-specific restriction endonuclease McrA
MSYNHREYSRGWRERNRERIREADRARKREPNREYHREYSRGWRERNRERTSNYDRCRDRKRAHGPYVDVLRSDPCSYCGDPMEHVDHIEPSSKGGRNEWPNFTASCGRCNSSKGAKNLLFFLMDKRDTPATVVDKVTRPH